ncbi:MAG: NUDIX domain-containing protein [Candidatus Micrarchaeota archaeon]|nr:NUDIX domain-containing protein [Candidatus Micrarchaeota archaeon]
MINRRRILLLKRRNLPFVLNPGVWSLIFGAIESGEDPLETAYREIREETAIPKESLRLVRGPEKVLLRYERKGIMWYNDLYLFEAKTRRVKLDLENSAYRWASLDEIRKGIKYTNIFISEDLILSIIKSGLNESGNTKGKGR